jgi:hypothetical protein
MHAAAHSRCWDVESVQAPLTPSVSPNIMAAHIFQKKDSLSLSQSTSSTKAPSPNQPPSAKQDDAKHTRITELRAQLVVQRGQLQEHEAAAAAATERIACLTAEVSSLSTRCSCLQKDVCLCFDFPTTCMLQLLSFIHMQGITSPWKFFCFVGSSRHGKCW